MNNTIHQQGIPISPSLDYLTSSAFDFKSNQLKKRRLLYISVISVLVAIVISVIAKLLVYLINIITNLFYYGSLTSILHSPSENHLGLWAIIIPSIGGIIVGTMALYGSKAIRGHGIPEAMEQILTNESRIKPSIAFLKPISSAIAIGSGGPFGAEGPIIATGGALGSTIGQLLKITSNERKIILAAGATAGMSAIFGTPIAAVFLAIELLLFEFSPKSILPVALSCITGAAGHHLLFESGPVFPMPDLAIPSNSALAIYSLIGIVIGFLSVGLTKTVYFVEDCFEKLPIHWMWWPAIGGLVVGIVGYFQPNTLGVGYDNIINLLSGTVPLIIVINLAIFKFLSWSVALGSGTSGGTLAPLMTIGGACGAVVGSLGIILFPYADISLSMAALIGMSAMFAGASRAYLTSIAFAMEATMQSHALLPLLGACTASYIISFLIMENTIMTEKIARRGIHTPDSYTPDIFQKLNVSEVIQTDSLIISSENTIGEVKSFLENSRQSNHYFLVVDQDGSYMGTVDVSDIYINKINHDANVLSIVKKNNLSVKAEDKLIQALDIMAHENTELIAVISAIKSGGVIGVLNFKDILSVYKKTLMQHQEERVNLSLRRQKTKILVRGRSFIKKFK